MGALLRSSTLLFFSAACAAPPPPTAAPPKTEAACAKAESSAPGGRTEGSPAPRPKTVDAVAEELLRRMNARDAAAVVALFSGPMRDALPEAKVRPWLDGLVSAKGALRRLAREPGSNGERRAVFRIEAERGEWQLDLTVDKEGTVLGLKLGDPPAPDPDVAKSTIPLGLPFRGQWSVFWGGPTLEVNQHVPHRSQRRAADLLVVDDGGKTHKGDGKRNDDYYAYGKDVLAVADGTVVTVVDGVPDNEPGVMSSYYLVGNSVVLEHEGKLYSAYAHLQPGKIRVKPGAKVKRGTVLGLCGNSGNTSEPHLHFQLQDGPRWEQSWGVEAVFKDVPVVRGGAATTMASYTWLKGDLVGAPETPAKPTPPKR